MEYKAIAMSKISISNHHHDKINIYTFPNGFRVIYQKPKQSLPITSINVFCKVGSIFETKKVRGVSHFVEHMCFKGTTKIIHPNEIFMNYDKIGAYINAYTEKEYTCYTLKCADIYVKNSTHILADMMLNSTIIKKEFTKEQKVVVEENVRNINDNEWYFFDKLQAIFYAGSSFAYPIDSIEYHPNETTLKYEDVVQWYKSFYCPENMVFSITSNLSFKEIIQIVKTSYFATKKNNTTYSNPNISYSPELTLLPMNPNPNPNSKIRIELLNKKGMSTHFVGVGFRTCNNKNPDRHPLNLLNQVLNELSGRLFTLLREKHGLTYHSSCVVEYKVHTGYFFIYAESDPHKSIYDTAEKTKTKTKSDGVLPIIMKLIRDLIKNGITTDELHRFKGNMKGKQLINLENIDTITNYNGIEYSLSTHNDTIFQHEFIDYNDIYETYIDTITKKQIHEVIRKYFVVENMVVSILGEKCPSFKEVVPFVFL